MAIASTTEKDRVAWIDYSKGICIVAVVALYTTMIIKDEGETSGWMQYWVDFARPFRMPDFFLIAGLFLNRTIDVPWRRYLDKKVIHFFYFLVVWSTIYFILSEARFNHFMGEPHSRWQEYFWLYVDPFHMLWFIQMLPVCFVVTRLVKRIPWFVVLPAAALLQVFDIDTAYDQLDRFCERYVYFYAGYKFASAAFRLADWAGRNGAASIGLLCVWALTNQALVLLGFSEIPMIGLALGFAGAGAVIVAGRLLSALRGTAWLRHLGQNSIVVFLSFFIFTVVTLKILRSAAIIDDAGWRAFLATLAGVFGPVLAFRFVRDTPARFLFTRPRWAGIAHPAASLQAGAARPTPAEVRSS